MAKKITFNDKSHVRPYGSRDTQIWDLDINQIKEVVNANADLISGLEGGYQGRLMVADIPLNDGYYQAGESGIYINAGGLVVDLISNITFINVSENKTAFTKTEIPINLVANGIIEKDNNDAVSGGKVYDKTINYNVSIDKQIFTSSQENQIIENIKAVKRSEIYNISYSKNLINTSNIIQDYRVDSDSGELIYTSGFFVSEYIDCSNFTNYIANRGFSFIAFYDAEKKYISGIADAGQLLITPPITSCFMIISTNGNVNDFQVESGTISTSSEPYHSPIELDKYESITNKINKTKNIPSVLNYASEFLVNDLQDTLNRTVKVDATNLFNKDTVIVGFYPDPGQNGNLIALSGWNSSDFMMCDELTTYSSNIALTFVSYYDKNQIFLSGVAVAGQYIINTPINCEFIRVNISDIENTQIELGTVPTTYKNYKKTSLILNNDVVYNYVTVSRNEADFNSIRETIDAIIDANPLNRYKVIVPIGSWFECDLIGKDYIEIIGQDKYLTILYCDGTSTNVTPSNYSFNTFASTPLNLVPQSYKHCFNARNNIKVSNLTVNVNDAKYCAHLDSNTGNDLVEFFNCRFYAGDNVNYTIGIGLNGGQEIGVYDCEFERLTSGLKAILYHNSNNQTLPSKLTIKNSDFKNCSYLLLDELGSDQEDLVKLINCKSDVDAYVEWMVDSMVDGKTYWTNPLTGLKEQNPQNVPYCIKLNFTGTRVTGMSSLVYPFGSYGLARPNYENYINGELYTFHFSKSIIEPINRNSGGEKGEIRIINGIMYICIETNTWVKEILAW